MDSAEVPLIANLENALRKAYERPLEEDSADTVPGHLAPIETEEEPAIPDRIGRYRVLGVIARGGMGAVLRAEDPELGREVAVKISRSRDPGLLARFAVEARICSQLAHPGIVPIHEVRETEDGRPCYVMKLVVGETLASLLSACPSPGAESARMLDIFRSVCQTMAYVHSRGIFHGDLKPANIMVGAFGEVQVMDWGFAGPVMSGPMDGAGSGGGPPDPPLAAGTPAYMPPEQARADGPGIGIRSDVFSLGAILCEILTGAPPYRGVSRAEVFLSAARGWLDEAYARLAESSADPALSDLARTCLAPRLEDRPADAGAVSRILAELASAAAQRAREAEIALTRAQERESSERRARRLTLALSVAVVLGLIAGGAGFFLLIEERRSREVESARVVHDGMVEAHRRLAEARVQEPPGAEAWAKAEESAAHAVALAERSPAGGSELDRARGLLSEARSMKSERLRQIAFQEALEEIEHHAFEENRPEPWMDVAYREAFRENGVDPGNPMEGLPAEERSRAPLGLALARWSLIRRRTTPGDSRAGEMLLRAAMLVDPDPRRRELCSAFLDGDGDTLREAGRVAGQRADPPETMLLLSRFLWELRHSEEAVLVLRATCRRHPSDFLAHHDLAVNLQREQPVPWAEIIRLLSVCVAVRPSSTHALTDLGIACHASGDLGRAADLLGRATAIPSCRARAWIALASALQGAGEPDAAASAAAGAIDREEDVAALVRFGVELRQRGLSGSAGTAFRKAARLSPGLALAHEELGRHELDRGFAGLALPELKKAVELAPSEARCWHLLGRTFMHLAQWSEASAAFTRATELDGRSAAAFGELGRALLVEGRTEEALAALDQACGLAGGGGREQRELFEGWLAESRRAAEFESPESAASSPRRATAGGTAEIAHLAMLRGWFQTSAALYEEAFSGDPALRDSWQFEAARAAAFAGRGIGTGTDRGGEGILEHWRGRARKWLSDELAEVRAAMEARPADAAGLRRRLSNWKIDPAFIAERLGGSFDALPLAERTSWSSLWTDVDRLISAAEQPSVAPGVVHEKSFSALSLGLTGPLAALEFATDGSALLVVTNAGFEAASIQALPVVRDPASRSITGFGPPRRHAAAAHADGGLEHEPGGTLMWTTWTEHELGQLSKGGRTRRFPLDASGVPKGGGGLTFVPPGRPGAGDLLVSSYVDGGVYRIGLAAGGDGTFAPVPGSAQIYAHLPRGSEGLRHVPAGPLAGSLLVCNWDTGTVSVVGSEDPPIRDRAGGRSESRPLLGGIAGASGLAFDPVSGALLVSTWGSGNRIHVFSGIVR